MGNDFVLVALMAASEEALARGRFLLLANCCAIEVDDDAGLANSASGSLGEGASSLRLVTWNFNLISSVIDGAFALSPNKKEAERF